MTTLDNVLFLTPLQKSAILTTVGVLEQPLGNARLHVARLVAALLQTSAPSICQELCNLATMDLLLVGKAWLSLTLNSEAPFCHCTHIRSKTCLSFHTFLEGYFYLIMFCVFISENVASDLHKVCHEGSTDYLITPPDQRAVDMAYLEQVHIRPSSFGQTGFKPSTVALVKKHGDTGDIILGPDITTMASE